jgi:two-component system phosphate regulon sensor histidine kinase PhoR/two-component system sensor histidine kinase VicK
MGVKRFFQSYRLQTLAFAISTQIIVGLLMALWVLNALALDVAPDNFILLYVAPFMLLEMIASAIITAVATKPAHLITEAVAHAAKEPGTEPPDVEQKKYKKNGLQSIVKTIYELGGRTPKQVTEITGQEIVNQMIEHMPVGVVMLDDHHRILHKNKHAPLHENAENLSDLDLLFEQNDSLAAWLKKCEENEIQAQNTWTRIPIQPGEEKKRQFYDVLASYSKKGEGGIDIIILTVDRTKEYAPDEEAMDFIALAAHELRGPITVIHGYLDVLSEELHDQLDDDYRALLERLTVSASRLSSYVNNILNASRFDRRHFKLHLSEYKLQNLYRSVAEDLNMRARTQNRLLSVSIPNDLPTVAADKNSIGEVMTNLVDNAIKYSNEGGQVIVKARVAGDYVEVSVSDSGIGMPANVVQKLFTKFYRSHRSRETVAGTGLGLYISKAIIESHGGTITVRSVEGHGSTFIFTLPIYSTVADKLLASDNKNEAIIENSNGWIKNHAMYRG